MSTLQLKALQTRHLRAVDLQVDDGECVALSGPSGSGKSLLLRAIADLDPHGGEVRLDDRPSSAFGAPQWRRMVGLLPAESPWWRARVGEHFHRPPNTGLAALGLAPEVVDWEVERLSSGERQRLALLRLLANEPRALLLDEPTANLDPVSAGQVEKLVREYRRRTGAAVLWVSHDPEQIARVADRALRMRDGMLERDA